MTHAATPTDPSDARWDAKAIAATLILAVVTAATYCRVVSHRFTWWDDHMTLHHNPRYNPPSGQKIRETWLKPVDGLYAPLTYTYWGALAYLAELPEADDAGIHLDARIFHAGSLILHLLAVLVVFAILKLLSQNVWASLGGALLFALHPVQVEAVAWASGAKDLLCGLLSLCAIYQYLRFAKLERDRTRERWTCYASGAVLLLLAMLAKPAAMVVPAIVAVLDILVVGRPWRKALPCAGGWAVVVLPLAVIARVAQTADNVSDVAFWQRPLIACDAIAFYLWKLVWPANLTPDYARRSAIVLSMWGGAGVYMIATVPAAIAIYVWRRWNRWPWVAAGSILFVAAIAPVLGLTPFMFQYTSNVADHYLYLAMFGPALLLTWLMVRYPQRFVRAGLGVAIVVLAVRANVQLSFWRDDATLWAHTMRISPDSFVAPSNLAADLGRQGYALGLRAEDLREQGKSAEAARLIALQRRDWERAVELLERSIAIRPNYIVARQNAFIDYLRLGNYAKAVEHLEFMLAANEAAPPERRSNFNTYHDAAGNLWMKLGRYDKAIAHYEKLLAAVPDHAGAKQGLAEARRKRAAEARIDPAARE